MSSVNAWARAAFAVTAWLFAGCTIVQIYLAGLGVFQSGDAFLTHRDFGYIFGLLTILLIALAVLGRLPRRFVVASVVLLVLFALQSVFVLMRTGAPVLAALHPLNGFVIAGIAVGVAWAARGYFSRRPPIDAAQVTAAGDE